MTLYDLLKDRIILLEMFLIADVIEGSRFYENIFVSGGALLTDDSILKTIELGNKIYYGVQFAQIKQLSDW